MAYPDAYPLQWVHISVSATVSAVLQAIPARHIYIIGSIRFFKKYTYFVIEVVVQATSLSNQTC